MYQFFWGEFCDWYVELVKLRLDFGGPNNDAAQLTLNALVSVFEAALRLLSPFMPFLTEELWHALYGAIEQPVPAKSIALTRFPLAGDFVKDEASIAAMQTLQELIVTVRALRKDLGVPEKEPAAIRLHSPIRLRSSTQDNADMFIATGESECGGAHARPLTGNGARSAANFDVAVVYERQIDVAAERERLTKEIAKYEKGLQAAEKQLNNPGFVAKAPAHIIEGLKKQAAETRSLREKAKAALIHCIGINRQRRRSRAASYAQEISMAVQKTPHTNSQQNVNSAAMDLEPNQSPQDVGRGEDAKTLPER